MQFRSFVSRWSPKCVLNAWPFNFSKTFGFPPALPSHFIQLQITKLLTKRTPHLVLLEVVLSLQFHDAVFFLQIVELHIVCWVELHDTEFLCCQLRHSHRKLLGGTTTAWCRSCVACHFQIQKKLLPVLKSWGRMERITNRVIAMKCLVSRRRISQREMSSVQTFRLWRECPVRCAGWFLSTMPENRRHNISAILTWEFLRDFLKQQDPLRRKNYLLDFLCFNDLRFLRCYISTCKDSKVIIQAMSLPGY